jgi:hypothetical protein
VSLLSRIREAQAHSEGASLTKAVPIEALRERARARLFAREARLAERSMDDELASVWVEPLERIARDERLEHLGNFS